MNRLVRGLLQVVLDTRAFRRIRLKVFARPDQLEEISHMTQHGIVAQHRVIGLRHVAKADE